MTLTLPTCQPFCGRLLVHHKQVHRRYPKDLHCKAHSKYWFTDADKFIHFPALEKFQLSTFHSSLNIRISFPPQRLSHPWLRGRKSFNSLGDGEQNCCLLRKLLRQRQKKFRAPLSRSENWVVYIFNLLFPARPPFRQIKLDDYTRICYQSDEHLVVVEHFFSISFYGTFFFCWLKGGECVRDFEYFRTERAKKKQAAKVKTCVRENESSTLITFTGRLALLQPYLHSTVCLLIHLSPK